MLYSDAGQTLGIGKYLENHSRNCTPAGRYHWQLVVARCLVQHCCDPRQMLRLETSVAEPEPVLFGRSRC